MVSADPSEVGRIDIRLGLRPPPPFSLGGKARFGSGGSQRSCARGSGAENDMEPVFPDGRPLGRCDVRARAGNGNAPATKNPTIPRG